MTVKELKDSFTEKVKAGDLEAILALLSFAGFIGAVCVVLGVVWYATNWVFGLLVTFVAMAVLSAVLADSVPRK